MKSLIAIDEEVRRSPAAKRQRGEVQDRVLEKLRSGLMIGVFVPGQTITLRRLAEMLGTSPMPVRKAIHQLTAANALEILPNRSVAVPRMSAERLKDLTRVRQAVEGLAAELACANATSALVRDLTAINARLRQAIRQRNMRQSLEMNQRFHFTFYAMARSPILASLIESLWLQVGPILYISLADSDMPWDAVEHEHLLKAIKSRRPAAARRAIVRDIGGTTKSLLRLSTFNGQNARLGAFRIMT
jgi:DNA-binding GntR family transcriptional regulator